MYNAKIITNVHHICAGEIILEVSNDRKVKTVLMKTKSEPEKF
jgi:hypothetical protein